MRVIPIVIVVGCLYPATSFAQEHEEAPPPLPAAPVAKATTTVTFETQPTHPEPKPVIGASGATAVTVDQPQPQLSAAEQLAEQKLLTGFRLGYLYVFDHKKPQEALEGQSLAQKTGMRSPHQFLIGYEAFYRMLGHSGMNVLLVANAMISGLEQSKFYPSGNGLIGFEFRNSFQLGVGVNVTPLKGSEAHTIVAAGWTPRSGSFYVPIHAFFVPDVDGSHRVGVTTGVTF